MVVPSLIVVLLMMFYLMFIGVNQFALAGTSKFGIGSSCVCVDALIIGTWIQTFSLGAMDDYGDQIIISV